jgi:hypothetical protein
MAKAAKKLAKRTTKATPRPRRRKAASDLAPRKQGSAHADTKQSRAIAMLRSSKGASIAALMGATGWQQHSVRGFLAGVVRKRLGLELESSKVDGCRIYRIAGANSAGSESAAEAES